MSMNDNWWKEGMRKLGGAERRWKKMECVWVKEKYKRRVKFLVTVMISFFKFQIVQMNCCRAGP